MFFSLQLAKCEFFALDFCIHGFRIKHPKPTIQHTKQGNEVTIQVYDCSKHVLHVNLLYCAQISFFPGKQTWNPNKMSQEYFIKQKNRLNILFNPVSKGKPSPRSTLVNELHNTHTTTLSENQLLVEEQK